MHVVRHRLVFLGEAAYPSVAGVAFKRMARRALEERQEQQIAIHCMTAMGHQGKLLFLPKLCVYACLCMYVNMFACL